jgi:hypothetical protein
MSVAATSHSEASAVPTQQRVIGWALLVCWVGLVICTLVLGHRTSTFAQLEADVAAGKAADVHVAGGLDPDSTGFSLVQVEWRRGMLGYSTEVLEVRPRREAGAGRASNDVTRVLVDQTVAERLAEIDPGLPVATTDWRGWHPVWDGWTRPAWMGVAGLAALVATVALLAYGPAPQPATRWGWFWLIVIAAPLGALAYLLMGAATATSSATGTRSDRRLTGWWALLLALVVEYATGAVVTAVL